ncbi:hypothetical protein AQUCO_00200804v1 [Aquilegia coerulea]|uniref:BHLH domain-containing protein n=1 Tax=Aquilegia coerulea TaxID=218851 RepID=A0A2G5F4S2_AQUCA|nr:hypothetical protein AQUCO_00200804v1 [Aquilegia coerulea]
MSSKQSSNSFISTVRRNNSRRRRTPKPRVCKPRKTLSNGGKRVVEEHVGVSEKLEALKNLIPAKNEEMKADQLFEETADYIVFLKTQVEVLQRLIDLYGSKTNEQKKVV